MPRKKPQLVNNEIYHVVLRGVGDSLVFKDVNDYFRGIFSIYEFNNDKPVDIWLRRQERKREKLIEKGIVLGEVEVVRKPLTPIIISDPEKLRRVINFLNKIGGLDDVQKVYSNVA